jgi:hypothetical protein
MIRAILFLVAVAVAICPVWAARPLATDDAGTVEKGKYETELSFDHCQNRPDGTCQSPGIQLKHGLTDRMDIGFAVGHDTDKDADGNTVAWGMSPLAVGIKAALLKEHKTLPDLSISVGFESGASEWSVNGIASKDIACVVVHFNLGYESAGAPLVRGEYTMGLAAEYTVLKKVRVCAELNSELLDDGKHVIGNSGLVGGSATFGPAILDLGVRFFDHRGPKTGMTAGCTIGF